MSTEQDIIDATYIKKCNQIKLTIKKALTELASKNTNKGYVLTLVQNCHQNYICIRYNLKCLSGYKKV